MNRVDVLEKARLVVTGDRQEQHGSIDDTFGTISRFWSTYIGHEVTSEDVCHMMTLLKIARMQHGNMNNDDYVDSIGYQALAAEIAEAES